MLQTAGTDENRLYIWIKLACPVVSQTSVVCEAGFELFAAAAVTFRAEASDSSRDSLCIWGWPLGVSLNCRLLFCAMHQNPPPHL